MDFDPVNRAGRLWKSKADFFRPFVRAAAAEAAGENITPIYDPHAHRTDAEAPDLRDLNTALAVLVDVFPDIEPEIFREMLLGVSAESRVQVVTEQMLKRTKTVKKVLKKQLQRPSRISGSPTSSDNEVALEDTFRGDEYQKAVKQVLYQEFRNLSHSTIKGVMAEWNYSYTMSRPVLQQLATKSWRFSLSSLWSKRSPASTAAADHPYVTWQTTSNTEARMGPAVIRTGSAQLDHELFQLFVEPVLIERQQSLLTTDHAYACQINEADAEETGAIFDCECCFNGVSFENISTCDDQCHQLCLDCVQRTVKEALYGQGWARTASLEKSTVRCFAPTSQICNGCIPAELVQRALTSNGGNDELWPEFERRVANETLVKSRVLLQRCPFCSYAEAAETPAPKFKTFPGVYQHVIHRCSVTVRIMALFLTCAVAFFTVPLFLLATLLWFTVQFLPAAAAALNRSWSRVHQRRRGLRFRCQNPTCCKTSCIRCTAQWRDPHACFETEKTSLRTAIEASATAAIKRTCPKCLLSFVKSSGCNKLVCNCGYTMCYVCRQEITSKEGYSHFCQHFRPNGGRCGECEKCDLYGDEDEEAAIRRAAESAKKAWREREGEREGDQIATQLMVEALVGQARHDRWYEAWLDAMVDAVVA